MIVKRSTIKNRVLSKLINLNMLVCMLDLRQVFGKDDLIVAALNVVVDYSFSNPTNIIIIIKYCIATQKMKNKVEL